MIGYLAQRFASLIFTLLLATVAIFAMMHSVPGGPFTFTQGDMTPAAMHNIQVKYGLADPIWQQYFKWIWQLMHGYLGIPFEEPTMTVNHLIASAWPITLIVGGLTITLSYSLGLLLGCIAALKHNTWVDSLITAVVSTIGVALPNYVIGILFIEVFAIRAGWFPVGGWGSWKDVVLPVIAFSLYPMALMERYTRASTLEVTYADYVRMGRARGLSERRILTKYILRTSLIPLITIMGPSIPQILTGSIFIEATFALPGLGSYFTTASLHRDYPLIMALVLIVAALWGVCFILSDIAYVLVDPRVRLEGLYAMTAVPLPGAPVVTAGRASGSFWHAAWYRYRRNRLALVAGAIAVVIGLVAVLAPFIAPYGDASIDLTATLAGASGRHLLGTDQLGRDTLTRAIWGARTSMTIAIGAPLIGLAIGMPLGIIAGWTGGILDWVTLRLFELFSMVPTILAALLFITVFGVDVWKLALFIGITLWVGFGRLARAQYLALRNRDFVLAAHATGVPAWRITIVHILPNTIGPIIVYFVQQVPYVIFTAAGFSFLGLGVQDPLADWGKMINDSVSYLQVDPLLVLVPIGCIGLACLSFSFLGDGLRDRARPDLTVGP